MYHHALVIHPGMLTSGSPAGACVDVVLWPKALLSLGHWVLHDTDLICLCSTNARCSPPVRVFP